MRGRQPRAAVRGDRRVLRHPGAGEGFADRLRLREALAVEVRPRGQVDRSRDVSRDRVVRLGLAAVPLGRAHIDQHPARGPGLGLVDRRDSLRSARRARSSRARAPRRPSRAEAPPPSMPTARRRAPARRRRPTASAATTPAPQTPTVVVVDDDRIPGVETPAARGILQHVSGRERMPPLRRVAVRGELGVHVDVHRPGRWPARWSGRPSGCSSRYRTSSSRMPSPASRRARSSSTEMRGEVAIPASSHAAQRRPPQFALKQCETAFPPGASRV